MLNWSCQAWYCFHRFWYQVWRAHFKHFLQHKPQNCFTQAYWQSPSLITMICSTFWLTCLFFKFSSRGLETCGLVPCPFHQDLLFFTWLETSTTFVQNHHLETSKWANMLLKGFFFTFPVRMLHLHKAAEIEGPSSGCTLKLQVSHFVTHLSVPVGSAVAAVVLFPVKRENLSPFLGGLPHRVNRL